MKLLKAKKYLILAEVGAVAILAYMLFVILAAIFTAVTSEQARKAHDCTVKKTDTSVTVPTENRTVDDFVSEHEEAYILSWKAGGYLPSFSIAQTFVEYGFNFTNPSGTSFWLAHNMGGVKTGGSIDNFPITIETYGKDAVDLSGTKLGTNVGDNTGGNYAWFKSYDAGIVAKAEFMAHQTLYKGAINNTEPREISKAIAQGGWASDPTAYENSLNNAYDTVGAKYKWLDEKAIKRYGKSPFVEIGPVQPSNSLGVTTPKSKGKDKCKKRKSASDGTGKVPSGVQVDGSGWKPKDLPAELKDYIIEPQQLGLEYDSTTGWVEQSGECVDLTVSLGNILWGHSGTVIGDGKDQASAWSKIFGNSTNSKARKGAIFSSMEEATYGHTGVVCHVFEDGTFLVVEQNYSVSGNAIGKKNTYSYRLISQTASEKNGFTFAYGNESNLKLTKQ